MATTVTIIETPVEVRVDETEIAVDITETATPVTVAAGVTDHGALSGLADDDHAQYLTTARHAAIGSNPHGVTAADVGALALSGGTMTGKITLDGDPTAALEAATKQYVDNNAGGGASDVDDLTTATGNAAEMVRVAAAGGLEYRTPAEVLSDIGAAATAHAHALDDLSDVDAAAPADGDVLTWVDANSAWEPVAGGGSGASDVSELTTTGLTSPNMLRVAAAGGLEERTPAQVVGDIAALPLAGGTMTGAITFTEGTTAADGIVWGADTNLYRYAANTLRTDDGMIIGTRNYTVVGAGSLGISGGFACGSAGVSPLTTSVMNFIDSRSWASHAQGINVIFNVTAGSANRIYHGIQAAVRDTATNANNIGSLIGIQTTISLQSAVTAVSGYGLLIMRGAGTITNSYGIRIATATSTTSNNYGLYIEDQTNGSGANYAIYTGVGAVRLGDALTVIQDSATGAVPVLTLQQDDVSEEIFEITSVAGEGNAIEAVGAKTLTVTEYIKITINGNTRYIAAGTIS